MHICTYVHVCVYMCIYTYTDIPQIKTTVYELKISLVKYRRENSLAIFGTYG